MERHPADIMVRPTSHSITFTAACFCLLARPLARWKTPWLGALILEVFAGDLFYGNFANNQMAYARTSYDQLYGQGENLFQRAVASQLPPLMRFDSAQAPTAFGPLAHYF